MHSLSYLVLACTVCLTIAQYDSPAPPRPIIPGAIPLGASPVGGGGGRPVLRRRPQAAIQDAAPPRRISTGGRAGGGGLPARRLPPQLEQSLVSQRPSRPSSSASFSDSGSLIRAPPQLPSPPPIPQASPSPSPLPQYSPQPAIQISPRPVIEETDEEQENIPQQPQQLSFRPSPLDDLPVPTRQQYRPTPQPVAEEEQPTYVRQRPQPQPEVAVRQPARQSPVRQQQQQSSRGSSQQYSRQQQVVSKQAAKELDKPSEQIPRGRKPQVQNIRKFRLDNEDGSITWGFENDDGTYKEETIGVDCVTRGKYGYYSPDGIMREFTYESGIPCDKRDAETEETNEGYIDYSNNKYVFPNGEAIDLDNMVKNKARKQPQYRN